MPRFSSAVARWRQVRARSLGGSAHSAASTASKASDASPTSPRRRASHSLVPASPSSNRRRRPSGSVAASCSATARCAALSSSRPSNADAMAEASASSASEAGAWRGKAPSSSRTAAMRPSRTSSSRWSPRRRAACGQSPARLRVADRPDVVTVPLVPLAGGAVERGDERGVDPSQLHPQHVREQRVIAEPRAPDVDAGHEGAGVVELLQDPHGSRCAGQGIRERPADALEHGGAQQQLAHLGPLAVHDLCQQICRDGALAARELAREALGIRVRRELYGGEAQPAGPALAALVEHGHAGVRQCDPSGVEQLARLARSRTADRPPAARSDHPRGATRGAATPSARA